MFDRKQLWHGLTLLFLAIAPPALATDYNFSCDTTLYPEVYEFNHQCYCREENRRIFSREDYESCQKLTLERKLDSLKLTMDSVKGWLHRPTCQKWEVAMPFDPVKECPKPVIEMIWKDRLGLNFSWEAPKHVCPVLERPALNTAEALESYLASDPASALGLPEKSLTNPKCLPTDFGAWNRTNNWTGVIPTYKRISEQERMMVVSEYYYDMNKIKYGERAILDKLALVDSILGNPLVPDADCADPNNPFLARWCEKYRSCGTDTKALKAYLDDIKKGLDARAAAQAKLAELNKYPSDQPEIASQVEAIKAQIGEIENQFPLISQPLFRREYGTTRNVESAVRRQLTNNREELQKRFQQFREASHCLNSATRKQCRKYENILDSVPDDFLHLTRTSPADDKRMVAQSYLDRNACYKSARETKKRRERFFLDAELTVLTGLGVTSEIAAARGLAWGTTALYGASNYYQAGKSCYAELHQLNDVFKNENADAFSEPSCPNYTDGTGPVARRKYAGCVSDLLMATAKTAAGPGFSLFRTIPKVATIEDLLGTGLKKKALGALETLIVMGPVNNIASAYYSNVLNILIQMSTQSGSKNAVLSSLASGLHHWLSHGTNAQKQEAIKQIGDSIDPSAFDNIDNAKEIWSHLSDNAYAVLMNNQKVLPGDQQSARGMMRDKLTYPLDFGQRIANHDTNMLVNQNEIEKIQGKIATEHRAATADEQQRIQQAQGFIEMDRKFIAANLAVWTLLDWMYAEYRQPINSQAGKSPTGSPASDQLDSANEVLRHGDFKLVAEDVKDYMHLMLPLVGFPPEAVEGVMKTELDQTVPDPLKPGSSR